MYVDVKLGAEMCRDTFYWGGGAFRPFDPQLLTLLQYCRLVDQLSCSFKDMEGSDAPQNTSLSRCKW